MFISYPGFHQSSAAQEPYFLDALLDPSLPFLSHKVTHYDVWNCASIFHKYLPFTFSATFFPQYLLHLPTSLKPDCALWTLFLQGKFLYYGFYVLSPSISLSETGFGVLPLTHCLSDSIFFFGSWRTKYYPLRYKIAQLILSWLLSSEGFFTPNILLKYCYYSRSTPGPWQTHLQWFFSLTPIISTHLHRHTLDQIITSIPVQLVCSQKASFRPHSLVQLHPPWSALINLRKHL